MLFTSLSKRFFSTNTALRQYPFLKTLGLAEANGGVYRAGEWVSGNGATHTSINPHNNQEIASTTFGTADDYNECVEAMDSEQ